jgi:hypothetical protein
MKGAQEMTFNLNKSILNKPWISWSFKNRDSMPYQTRALITLYHLYYRNLTGKT